MPRLTTRTPRAYQDRGYAYVKINGRRVPLGKWGSDQARENYDRLISEWLAAGRRPPTPTAEVEPATVTRIAVAYITYATDRYGAAKANTIKSAIRLLRQRYGSEPADNIGPKRLRVVRDVMVRKGWSRRYINAQVRWIRTMFKWAASHELCSERIYRRLETLPGLRRGEGGKETAKVRPVPRADLRRARRYLTRPVRALVDLQLLTGARAGELLNLRATDIQRSGSIWTYKPTDHKTAHHDHERTLYFGPRAQRVLRQFMRPGRALDKPLFSPRESNAEAKRRGAAGARRPDQRPNVKATDRVMGDAYTTASYGRAIRRACKAAGVAEFGPHRLRHNAATFLRRQFGLDVASVVLGHSSLAVTQTYAELNDKKAREVMAKVG